MLVWHRTDIAVLYNIQACKALFVIGMHQTLSQKIKLKNTRVSTRVKRAYQNAG
jgi:hypothetical protein